MLLSTRGAYPSFIELLLAPITSPVLRNRGNAGADIPTGCGECGGVEVKYEQAQRD